MTRVHCSAWSGEALGHENIRTTTIYAHISTTKRRQEIERLLG